MGWNNGEGVGCPEFMVVHIFRRVLESNYAKFGGDWLKKSELKVFYTLFLVLDYVCTKFQYYPLRSCDVIE